MALSASNQVYGFGKLSNGQLGMQYTKGQKKFASVPTPISLPTKGKITKVACGSLYSTIMVNE